MSEGQFDVCFWALKPERGLSNRYWIYLTMSCTWIIFIRNGRLFDLSEKGTGGINVSVPLRAIMGHYRISVSRWSRTFDVKRFWKLKIGPIAKEKNLCDMKQIFSFLLNWHAAELWVQFQMVSRGRWYGVVCGNTDYNSRGYLCCVQAIRIIGFSGNLSFLCLNRKSLFFSLFWGFYWHGGNFKLPKINSTNN